MLILWQILLACVVTVLVLWAWTRAGRSRLGLVLAVAALAAFFGPWLAAADWALVGRAALWAALAGAAVAGYAWAIGRIRAAARDRGER